MIKGCRVSTFSLREEKINFATRKRFRWEKTPKRDIKKEKSVLATLASVTRAVRGLGKKIKKERRSICIGRDEKRILASTRLFEKKKVWRFQLEHLNNLIPPRSEWGFTK